MNGFAQSSIDTVKYHQQFTIYANQYFYDSTDYLINWVQNNNSSNTFHVINGDLIGYLPLNNSFNVNFTYYDTINKIDIFWFEFYNGIVGKTYSHLIKYIERNLDQGYFQNSFYTYSLYPNGFV
jgi:hypothetical protein